VAKTRIAIIGAGVIGRRHAGAIANSEKGELVAIADPFPGAVSIADELRVPCFDDNQAMFKQISPQAVIVATPTEHHMIPTLAALEAGAHVLVEKPITASIEEAEQIIAKSSATDRHVLVGHHRRYYGLVEKARKIVRGGELGKLVAVSGQWNVRKNGAYYEEEWRRKWQAGPILTNLIHEMDTLRYICGETISVMAETSNCVLGYEKEDTAAVIMRFENDALGTFILSDQTSSPWGWEFATGETRAFPKSGQNAIRFMGTKAALDFPNLMLWHHGNELADWNHPIECEQISMPLGDAFLEQINHFVAVIGGGEPRITARDGSNTLRAVLAVYESAQTGKRVML
jgi:predicted dehydrogenase